MCVCVCVLKLAFGYYRVNDIYFAKVCIISCWQKFFVWFSKSMYNTEFIIGKTVQVRINFSKLQSGTIVV